MDARTAGVARGEGRRRATYARGRALPSRSRAIGTAPITGREVADAPGLLGRGCRVSGTEVRPRTGLTRYPKVDASTPRGGVLSVGAGESIGTEITSIGSRGAAGTGRSSSIGARSSTTGMVARGGSSATTF